MIEGFVSGAVAGLGIAIPVGAVGALILLAAATSGWKVGAAAGMGAATADGAYAAIAVTAGAAIAPFLDSVSTPLRWASAVVLVVLGALMVRSALQASRDRDVSASGRVLQTPACSFAAVFAITIVNPLTVIYFAALVIGSSTSRGADVASGLPFIAGGVPRIRGLATSLSDGGKCAWPGHGRPPRAVVDDRSGRSDHDRARRAHRREWVTERLARSCGDTRWAEPFVVSC